MKQLDMVKQADDRRVNLMYWVIGGVFVVLALPGSVFLYMMFSGTLGQQELAVALLVNSGIAVAGYGVISAALRGLKSLFSRRIDKN